MVSRIGAGLVLTALTLPAMCLAQQTSVYIQSSANANDNIGTQLAYHLRESIRSSRGLRLVDAENKSAIQVRLVTLNPDDNNSYQTVYSAVITTGFESLKYYLTNYVGVCGRNMTRSCAEGLTANVDETATDLRKALMSGK